MEVIFEEKIVLKHGIAVRVVRDDKTELPFSVEQAPLSTDGEYRKKDFYPFGGTVGYDVSQFKTQEEAQQFFNDVIGLDSKQLAEKYPNIWVE